MSEDNVIPFPRQLRTVPSAAAVDQGAVLVEHDGHLYRWVDLFAELTLSEREQIDATAPRNAQQAWDEVIRRWPWLAAEMVAEIGATE